MTRNIRKLHGLALLTIGVALVGGCQKSGTSAPRVTTKSAETNSFQEVTSKLDAGGDLYVYLSTEQMLKGVSDKISGARQMFTSMPNASAEQQEQIGRAFDVVTSLVKDSGLEDVSGFGMSSIAVEKGFYRSKSLIHHYPGTGTGFLWKMFGEKPHALEGLNMLPANTALAFFSDVQVPLVWTEVEKQVKQAGIPQAEQALQQLPQKFEQATGMKWDQVLDSLGGEFGLVLTLNSSKMIPVPIPNAQGLEVPEPGLMIVAKVNDDTIFNRIDMEMEKHKDQVVRVDKPGLKMRTVPVPLPLPIELRPTVASSDGYLFIASSDSLVQEVLAVKAGKKSGLKSTDEFKRLSDGVPEQGNQFSFLSARFGQTIRDVQQSALETNSKISDPQREWLREMLEPANAAFSYCVSANTDEGWYVVGNGNRQPAKALLASAAIIPAAVAGAVAVPAFMKAKAQARAAAANQQAGK